MQLKGIGTSANILAPNLAACGPSVVHIIDQVRSVMVWTNAETGCPAARTQLGAATLAQLELPACSHLCSPYKNPKTCTGPAALYVQPDSH